MLKSKVEFISSNVIISLLYLIAIFQLLYESKQDHFFSILLPFLVAFICYLFFISDKFQLHKISIWIIFFFCYLFGIFSFPHLSDDVFRFLWDGHFLINDASPYDQLPNEIINQTTDEYLKTLYPKLNSKEYYSVYPLTCQLIFYLGSWLGKTMVQKVIAMKIFFVLLHLMGYFFVQKWNKDETQKIKWEVYYLNPLVISEGIGNLHAEIVMIGLLIPAFYFYFREKHLLSAIFFAFGIATKMTPLMLLPFFFFIDFQKNSFKFSIYVSIISIALFIPLFIGKNTEGFINSLDLYFRKFEFNASIYYVLRWLGKIITGYNQIGVIGPMLGLCLFAFIMTQSWCKSKWKIDKMLIGKTGVVLFSMHLILSTTVHPWYVITVLFFAALSQVKFPILWSFLIVFTYINYHGNFYQENYWVLAVEYLSLFLFILFNFSELQLFESKSMDGGRNIYH